MADSKSSQCTGFSHQEPLHRCRAFSCRPKPCLGQRLSARPDRHTCTFQRRAFPGSVRTHASPASASAQDAESTPSTSSTASEANTGPPSSSSWELDFSSRPVMDERGKKRWELLICSSDGSWKFSRYFPNNKINSTQLRIVLEEILSQDGAVTPRAVRFFRAQMQTIISRALADLGIRPVPSRRCFQLVAWLEDRLETVYKQDPGYSNKASSLFTLDLGPPEKLPDNLRGERWSFVQLPLAALREELHLVEQGSVFGDTISLQQAGLSDLSPNTSIPGVAVYSTRAKPLSAWTKGYDLANLTADIDRGCLILETGVNQRWRYASFRRSAENVEEAEAWQQAKKVSRGLHFLVVQEGEEADEWAGLWLLLEKDLPTI